MNPLKYLPLLFIGLSLWGCREESDARRAETAYRHWQGEKIVFPQGLQARIMGRDTSCADMLEAKAKILVYINSTGCSPCKMELAAWSLRLQEIDTMRHKPALLYVINTNNFRELDLGLKYQGFDYPVFYDVDRQMERLNEKLSGSTVNTFLLDRDNRVVLIGSPAHKDKLWELYKEQVERLFSPGENK